MPENDPFDPLDNFPEGLHVDSLPASEIRRRGDRMRRRNTALAAVGGVAAAAVLIGVPVALTSGDDRNRDIDPAPAPTQTEDPTPAPTTWLTEIPEGFPVTEGMTDQGEPTEGDLDAFPLCDTAYPTSRGTADSVTYFFSDDGESSATRVFQLWPDDAAAQESLSGLVAAIEACPQQPSMGGEDVIETRHLPFDLGGDDSVTFAQQYVADDGLLSQLTTVEVTRVGNAVLVDSNFGNAGGDEAIAIATEILADNSETTRAAMCVFAADPCAEAPEPSAGSSSTATAGGTPIPADFPLAQGMDADPEGGELLGPDRSVDGAPVVDVCGTQVWAPDLVTERLAVRETGIEYLETRELYTFPTADEASESVTQVREAVTSCPQMEGESYGFTTRTLEGPEGYDSFTWGYFADEGLDGAAYQLTRVGSAVLVQYATGEMSEQSLQPTADNLTQASLSLAPEMCVFTEDGC